MASLSHARTLLLGRNRALQSHCNTSADYGSVCQRMVRQRRDSAALATRFHAAHLTYSVMPHASPLRFAIMLLCAGSARNAIKSVTGPSFVTVPCSQQKGRHYQAATQTCCIVSSGLPDSHSRTPVQRIPPMRPWQGGHSLSLSLCCLRTQRRPCSSRADQTKSHLRQQQSQGDV